MRIHYQYRKQVKIWQENDAFFELRSRIGVRLKSTELPTRGHQSFLTVNASL